ncbi:SPOR domain-containing protein [Tenacibaculum sp. SG-28]|uniref:SPOR domain-containing protein n=1 Tax=Tenacibaculum sp. SG-28 TaxID=754426 RepID=UPI000CF44A44|nr:SPOR domain-containing protein [Tenacibaculum sp. SG-28]PQJ21207.1 hypothetical protein BSU00_09500 [Tenacibaculum sp. SG-28]
MSNKFYFIFFLSVLLLNSFAVNGQSQLDDNEEVTKLIEKKRSFNKEHKIGFRIQLYNGLETKAKSIRKRFQVTYGNIETHLIYKQPEWKTQVGYYKTRLEADRALNIFKKKFAGCIVIPI